MSCSKPHQAACVLQILKGHIRDLFQHVISVELPELLYTHLILKDISLL